MSSAETAPFGAVFVSRGASCSRRGRVSAAFSVRRVFILRSRFSVLDDELGRVGLPLSASISGPGRTWPRPVGRGSCGGARGIHSRPVARELLRVGLRARPVGRVALTRYSLELADPGLEFDQVLARARRSVGRGAWFAGRGSRVAGLRARAVGRGSRAFAHDRRRTSAACRPKKRGASQRQGLLPDFTQPICCETLLVPRGT
jgi:hypothetical protein